MMASVRCSSMPYAVQAGFTFNYGIYILNKAKFDATKAFIRHGGGFIVPYCVYISFAVLYGLTA